MTKLFPTGFFFLISIFLFNANGQDLKLEWANQWNYTQPFSLFSIPNVQSVATDADGSVYNAGFFFGTVDFNPGEGVSNMTSLPGGTMGGIYVSKLDKNGKFVWSRKTHDFQSGIPAGISIRIDKSGHIYLSGNARLVDPDKVGREPNIYLNPSTLFSDIFITKMNSSGDVLWSKNLSPSTGMAFAPTLSLDNTGATYLTGYFTGIAPLPYPDGTMDFDPGSGVYQMTPKEGHWDTFILKLNSQGEFVWAKKFGGILGDINSTYLSINTDSDPDNNIYISGYFSDVQDFNPGEDVFNLSASTEGFYRSNHIFLSKLDSDGNFLWAKQFGSNSYSGQAPGPMKVDSQGNVIFTGAFSGEIDLDPGENTYTLSSNRYGTFVTKLNPAGDLVWANLLEGESSMFEIRTIAIDATGNVYASGHFDRVVDFDPGPGKFELTSTTDKEDIFLLKLNPHGYFTWALKYGGNGQDLSRTLDVDNSGNLILQGFFEGPGTMDVDPGTSTHNLTPSYSNVFTVKLSQPAYNSPCELSISLTQDCGRLNTTAKGGSAPYSYQWKTLPSSMAVASIVGNNTLSHQGQPGNYYFVQVTDALGCTVNSDTIQADGIRVISSLDIKEGERTICPGDLKTISIDATGRPPFLYSWTKDDRPVSGAVAPELSISDGGTYVVEITDAGKCQHKDTLVIVALPIPNKPIINTPEGTQIGDTGEIKLRLTLSGTPAPESSRWPRQWFLNGKTISGATGTEYSAKETGTYTVSVSNLQCNNTSEPVVITGKLQCSPPPVPELAANRNQLLSGEKVLLTASAPGTLTFQWLRNDVEIPGANLSSYETDIAGTYSVRVTNTEGCQAVSASLTISKSLITGLKTSSDEIRFIASPNPTNGIAKIRIEIPGFSTAVIRVFDVRGLEILKDTLPKGIGYYETSVDLTPLSSGIYLISIETESGRSLHKIGKL